MDKLSKNPLDCPEKLVMAVMAKLGVVEIYKNLSKIHEGFYNFKKDAAYSQYFIPFRFNEMGLSPFSDLLDQILSMMENSDILETSNPSYEKYSLNVDYMLTQFDEFAPSNRKEFEEMGSKLSAFINN